VDAATTDSILAALQEKQVLFAVEKYPHSYPHCWRCKTELLFRLVDEWFIDMKWRDEIMEIVSNVTFLPESINGKAREMDWLKNMGDWMISKKRFWGLALPIWLCDECGTFDVIGSREELKKRAIEGWDKFEGHPPHRPWIDLVKVKCAECGATASRVPDVGNPWLDAGIVPYSTMKYNTDRAYWEQWFPADFITESFPGQFRNWFYAILAMSTMMTKKAPFKVLLGHAQVRDQWGDEMHKAKGNSIPFDEAAGETAKTTYTIKHELKTGEQTVVPGAISVEVLEAVKDGQKSRTVLATCPAMSADLIRWLYCRQNPAQNINFGPGPAEELRAKFTLKLWNTYAFFCNYARLDKFDPRAPQVPLKDRPDIDRWILSDLQLLIGNARKSFEAFNVMAFCLEAESFVDDKLSNWYVRRNRRRFWKSEQGADKLAAYQTLYTVMETLARLMAPVMPFLSESMFQNLVVAGGVAAGLSSVHHTAYPEVSDKAIDAQLSADMDALLRLVSLGQAVRQTAKIKVRQPLAEIRFQPGNDAERRAVTRFADQICDELNIKKATLHDASSGPMLSLELKPNPKNLGPKLGANLKTALPALDKPDAARKLWESLPRELKLPDDKTVTLVREDFFASFKGAEGWVGGADRDTQVAIDTRLTPELILEGMAREVIRNVQDSRKKAGLEMEDRIVTYLASDDAELTKAIDVHRDYIAAETLTVEWSKTPVPGDGVYKAEVKVDGRPLHIELRKATGK
jgi:isoleucyl-tRNA synthetase